MATTNSGGRLPHKPAQWRSQRRLQRPAAISCWTKNQSGKAASNEVKSRFNLIGWWASAVAMITVVLTLAGYGYDFGRLNVFGLTPEQLQRTPVDFLMRSYRAVFVLVQSLQYLNTRLLNLDDVIFVWFREDAADYGWLLLLCWLLLAVAVCLVSLRRESYLRRSIAVIGSWRGWGTVAQSSLVKNACKWVNWPRAVVYSAPLALPLLVTLMMYLLHVIAYAAGGILFIVVTTVPISMLKTAGAHAREEVIDPDHCQVGQLGKDASGVRCVRVVRNGCELARGRYIEQGGNRVWLLHKEPWQVVSVPLDGNVVEETDSEQNLASAAAPACKP